MRGDRGIGCAIMVGAFFFVVAIFGIGLIVFMVTFRQYVVLALYSVLQSYEEGL